MPNPLTKILKLFTDPRNIRLQNIIIITLTAVFLIAVSLYLLFPLLQSSQQNVDNLQKTTAENTNELLSLFLNLTFKDLAGFGTQLSEELNEDPKHYNALVKLFLASRDDFINVAIFKDTGEILAPKIGRDGEIISTVTPSPTETNFLKETLSGKNYISPVFFSSVGPTLQLAIPIEKNGKIVAVAVSEIDFTLLWQVVSQHNVPYGKIYLVDDRGNLIADPDTVRSRSGENLRYRDIINLLVSNTPRVASSRYTNEVNQNVLAYGLKMPDTNWGIIVEQNETQALAEKNSSLLLGLFFAVASIILILLIARATLRTTRSFLEVDRIRKEMERVVEYLPDGIIEYNGDNEIISINQSAKGYLGIQQSLPQRLKVVTNSPLSTNYDKLWAIFYGQNDPNKPQTGGQGKIDEITFKEPVRRVLKIITVYVKGAGEISEQRYLKILHDITSDKPE